jgi:hypothetical protein
MMYLCAIEAPDCKVDVANSQGKRGHPLRSAAFCASCYLLLKNLDMVAQYQDEYKVRSLAADSLDHVDLGRRKYERSS